MQSKMTHYDERCNEACVLYNRIAFRLLQGEEMKAVIQQELIGTEYESMLTSAPNCEASGFVVHTFRWVLHILLEATDFSEVVQRAANLGGDSDTIGAIAGGLAGIYYGYEQIPAKYAEAILIKDRLDEISVRLYMFGKVNEALKTPFLHPLLAFVQKSLVCGPEPHRLSFC